MKSWFCPVFLFLYKSINITCLSQGMTNTTELWETNSRAEQKGKMG